VKTTSLLLDLVISTIPSLISTVPPLTTPAMTIVLPELSAISVPELVTVPLS
jgi:hypothetical protein